jgi:hypothetical protein
LLPRILVRHVAFAKKNPVVPSMSQKQLEIVPDFVPTAKKSPPIRANQQQISSLCNAG